MSKLSYRGEDLLLHEDPGFVVVRKPVGLAVQTKQMGQRDLESLVKLWRAQKGAGVYVGVVHRLDQPVEGVMIFALQPKTAASLSRQAAGTGMNKEYLAVTQGCPPKKKGCLEDYLLRDGRTNVSRVVEKDAPGAKKAVLEYQVLGVHRVKTPDGEGEKALLRIRLGTGRHHQIRVQLAHAGCPLWGDTKYGNMQGTPALCAFRLSFRHPAADKIMTFSCMPKNPIFAEFEEVIRNLADESCE